MLVTNINSAAHLRRLLIGNQSIMRLFLYKMESWRASSIAEMFTTGGSWSSWSCQGAVINPMPVLSQQALTKVLERPHRPGAAHIPCNNTHRICWILHRSMNTLYLLTFLSCVFVTRASSRVLENCAQC